MLAGSNDVLATFLHVEVDSLNDVLKVLGVDDYLSRAYYKPDGAAVGLYMGFYNSQRQGDTIHSPLNCLPAAGWEPLSKSSIMIPVTVRTGPTCDSA